MVTLCTKQPKASNSAVEWARSLRYDRATEEGEIALLGGRD